MSDYRTIVRLSINCCPARIGSDADLTGEQVVPKLDIAVAGAGMIGRTHIGLIQASDACHLSGIVDPAAGAAEFARAAGVPRYATLPELFAAQHPAGVIVATPNQLHVENALDCIAAGVPVLVEKPLADSVAAGIRLRDAAERASATILVGHHRLHSPLLATACAIVQRGALGRLVAVTGSAMFYKPDSYFDEAPWRREPGGGPILINMIHEIGNLRALCGEIVAVQAFASNAIRGFPVEDTVAINLRFASGALGTFMLSDTAASARSWEQTSRENKSYATYDDEDCYVIVGTDGSLAVPTMRLKTYASREDRSWWKPLRAEVAPLDRADPLERQLAHFCAVIRGEAKPRVTARDGLANLRVTDAIAEAARTGKSIALD
jgi:predicted dehydrogenase